jgi:hypothetical protein
MGVILVVTILELLPIVAFPFPRNLLYWLYANLFFIGLGFLFVGTATPSCQAIEVGLSLYCLLLVLVNITHGGKNHE